MPQLIIPTSFNISLEFEVPDFGRRLGAWVIDIVVLFFYFLLYSYIMDKISESVGYDQRDSPFFIMLNLLLVSPFFFYHFFCEVFWDGQSVGKKLLKIKVISEAGSRPSLGQFAIRWLLRCSDIYIILIVILSIFWRFGGAFYFSFLGGLIIADIVAVIATPKSQKLADLAAGTLLISTAVKGSIEDSVFMHVADTYVPSFPQVMRLSDRDMNAIKNILTNAQKRSDYELAERTADRIKTVLKIESSISPFDFLDTVLKDYNFLSTR
jgi:uncharacterized RDD family membrane protein YckC